MRITFFKNYNYYQQLITNYLYKIVLTIVVFLGVFGLAEDPEIMIKAKNSRKNHRV